MIRRYSFTLFLLSMFSLPVAAQEARAPQRTTAPAESRFEIVQSELAVKFTARLDKYTGISYELVEKVNGDLTWQLIKRQAHPGDTSKIGGRVNYQIFTSGLTLKGTFLINVNTGATWQLVSDAKGEDISWQPIR